MTSPSLLSHVDTTIRTKNLFNKDATIIVALSGGADSCALLDVLFSLKEFAPRLIAAHINHKLRGDESDADEEFTRLLAARYNIAFESCQIDVASMARLHGLNLEDAGRRARYKYLEEIRTKHSAQAIALAHHADDQAETILMRLLRGSGMTGLSGMDYRFGYLIRPLLDVNRNDIEQYLKERGLEYRQDSSNTNMRFLRNRIRHELLPLLRDYNPNICKRLNTTASILADEDHFLDSIAVPQMHQVATQSQNALTFSVQMLLDQPLAIRRRILRTALAQLTGNLDNLSFDHIEAIQHLLESSRPNSKLNLPHGVRAVRTYDTITFFSSKYIPQKSIEPISIIAPGIYNLSNGSVLDVSFYSDRQDDCKLSSDSALVDLEKVPFPWEIRSFTPGDRITPLGMNGTKKIKNIYIDNKIPTSKRNLIPIICSGNILTWVCGICLSNLAKVDSKTRKMVKIIYSYND